MKKRDPEDEEEQEQTIIEDGTMSEFGMDQSAEVSITEDMKGDEDENDE